VSKLPTVQNVAVVVSDGYKGYKVATGVHWFFSEKYILFGIRFIVFIIMST